MFFQQTLTLDYLNWSVQGQNMMDLLRECSGSSEQQAAQQL